MSKFTSKTFTILLALLLCPAAFGDANKARELLRNGDSSGALDEITQLTRGSPNDPELRFMKGLVLTDMKRFGEAEVVFLELSSDYPNLPEPYNNLAALLARKGQLEKARDLLLKSDALAKNSPTIQENLGDLYVKMAANAYMKAISLGGSNYPISAKLDVIKPLLAGNAPQSSAWSNQFATGEKKSPQANQDSTQSTEQPNRPDAVAEITQTVSAWADAWSRRDIGAYFAHYSADFAPPGAKSRKLWEKGRRKAILAAEKIQVTVNNLSVELNDPRSAVATFEQAFTSNRHQDRTSKTLDVKLTDDGWKITAERSNLLRQAR